MNLIPAHKDDQDAVQRLQKCSYKEIEPIANELLQWLQDGNWPIAGPLSQILRPFTKELSPKIMSILNSNDYEWKYFLIQFLCNPNDNKLTQQVQHELKRIASNPTEIEIKTEVHELVLDMLKAENIT
jgi:hypothetical protein